jgi:threonyl-tRNA synthetase
MVAFLIEHFGGAFPTWLSPVQVQVVTVSDQFEAYGKTIVDRLRGAMVRAEMAPQGDTVSKKIREGTTRKIPSLLIVGEREQADGTVTLRRYGQTQQHTLTIDAFEKHLLETIASRALEFRL